MTKEEKQLLLEDLCARLPYGVMFDYNNNEPLKAEGIVRDIVYFKGYNYQTEGDECYANITQCKPYLRTISSMTEEERCLYTSFRAHAAPFAIVRWLDQNHFDHRTDMEGETLISLGLALEAHEGMYKI